MPTKGFRIKPDELLLVAQQVEDLHADVLGGASGSGNTRGNHTEFQTKAEPTQLSGALSTLFPGIGPGSAYVEAYTQEFNGLNEKYKAMVADLEQLAKSCRTTAERYGAEDETTREQAAALDPGAGSAPPQSPPPGSTEEW